MSEFESVGELMEKLLTSKESETNNFSYREHQQRKVDWYNNMVGNLHEADGYNCDTCKNRGFISMLGENDTEVMVRCKCQKVRATLRMAQQSGLGDIITEYTFDKYIPADEWQKVIKDKAMAFCQDEAAHWFYIGGQVGSGKTHICTAIAGYYIKLGREVKYMLWSEDAKNLKALVNDTGYQDEIAIYKKIDVLHIDDFLKVKSGEKPTPADINLAFEIINHRIFDKDKITIISSEKTLDDMLEYDEATMSRIYQRAGMYKINIGKDKSKNYRLREV